MSLNKRKLHHYLQTLRQLKTWQLLLVAVLMLFVSATLLRLNNLGMVERQQAVAKADESGDPQKIKHSLADLQRYVNHHMNTDMSEGIYLKQSYLRDRDQALQAATSSTNPNSAAYQQASIECRSRFQGGVASFRNDYVQCVIDRVGTLTQAQDPTAGINLPKVDLYRYNFVSPRWSPDLAGFAVLLTLLIGLLIITRLVLLAVVKLLLKKRYQRIYS